MNLIQLSLTLNKKFIFKYWVSAYVCKVFYKFLFLIIKTKKLINKMINVVDELDNKFCCFATMYSGRTLV